MPLTIVDGPTIAAGESLSDGVDLMGQQLVRITTPAGWDGANLTFQISSDGLFFNDLYDIDGDEITIDCGPARAIVLPAEAEWKAIAFLKVRSGSAAAPVPQSESRAFAVAVWSDA